MVCVLNLAAKKRQQRFATLTLFDRKKETERERKKEETTKERERERKRKTFTWTPSTFKAHRKNAVS